MLTIRNRAHNMMLCHVSQKALIVPSNLVGLYKKKKKNETLSLNLEHIIKLGLEFGKCKQELHDEKESCVTTMVYPVCIGN